MDNIHIFLIWFKKNMHIYIFNFFYAGMPWQWTLCVRYSKQGPDGEVTRYFLSCKQVFYFYSFSLATSCFWWHKPHPSSPGFNTNPLLQPLILILYYSLWYQSFTPELWYCSWFFPTSVFHTNSLLFNTNSSLLNYFLLPLVIKTASILPSL